MVLGLGDRAGGGEGCWGGGAFGGCIKGTSWMARKIMTQCTTASSTIQQLLPGNCSKSTISSLFS